MTDEKLIEETAKAIHDADDTVPENWGNPSVVEWDRQTYRRMARAAFAVFEKAHNASDRPESDIPGGGMIVNDAESFGREECETCGVRVWAGQYKRDVEGGGIAHQGCDDPYTPADRNYISQAAPTDDEREVVRDEAIRRYPHAEHGKYMRQALQSAFIEGATLAAGFRRSEVPETQGEPFSDHSERYVPKRPKEPQGEPTNAQVEAGAREAFFTDDAGGHIQGGYTWDTIPEVGRENYRTMVRGVLHAALRAAGGAKR